MPPPFFFCSTSGFVGRLVGRCKENRRFRPKFVVNQERSVDIVEVFTVGFVFALADVSD